MSDAHLVGNLQLFLYNVFFLGLRSFVLERMHPKHQIESNTSDGPPVCGEVVLVAFDNFRGQVLWRAARRVCIRVMAKQLCYAEIYDLQIALVV